MAVDLMRHYSVDDFFKERIDFTPAGTFDLSSEYTIGKDVRLLESEKSQYDKSTTGSPCTSHGDRQTPYGTSSYSSSSSPLSITAELTSVDSPGLSHPPKSPVGKQVFIPERPNRLELPQKRIDEGQSSPERRSRSPKWHNGHKRVEEEENSRSDEDDKRAEKRIENERRLENGEKRIRSTSAEPVEHNKLPVERRDARKSLPAVNKPVTVAVSKPVTVAAAAKPATSDSVLVVGKSRFEQRKPKLTLDLSKQEESLKQQENLKRSLAIYESSSDEEEEIPFVQKRPKFDEPGPSSSSSASTFSRPIASPKPMIGPQMPSREELEERRKAEQSEKPKQLLQQANGTPKRRRLLSERGERELSYPVMDKTTGKWNWHGCAIVSSRPRGAGLVNNSNDCFLNVILQMITHTAPLARYIVERHPNEECIRRRKQEDCMACGLSAPIRRSFQQPGPLTTGWIRPFLRRIFPSHCHGMQEDAHELLTLMLDAIDPPVGGSNTTGLPPGMPNTKLKASTPIEQIFGGTLRNQVTCTVCRTPYINYERIRELNLAISKEGNSVRLHQLVRDYFLDETVQQFGCKKCGRKTQATRTTRVLRAPAVLLVQLKRFNAYGGKIRQQVVPDREVQLSKYMFGEETSNFVLTGVVVHLGATVDHGHYMAYALGTDGKTWYHFDDESVSKVDIDRVQSANPYLLVYSRREHIYPGGGPGPTSSVPTTNGNKFQNGSYQPYSNGNGVASNGTASSLMYPGATNNGTPIQKKPYLNGISGGGQYGTAGGQYGTPPQNRAQPHGYTDTPRPNGYNNNFYKNRNGMNGNNNGNSMQRQMHNGGGPMRERFGSKLVRPTEYHPYHNGSPSVFKQKPSYYGYRDNQKIL